MTRRHHNNSGDDTINGNSRNNYIHSGHGDDTVNGNGGHDWLNGGSGNDTVNGGDGCDVVIGGRGDDIVDGGSGNDWVFGGSGNDVVNGGSGSDRVFAGRGNDEAVYNMAENGNAWDYYSGGRGDDLLTLEFTADEWARADVKADVDAYLQALEEQANSPSWWHGCAYFRFSSFDLTVSSFEALKIIVDGVEIDPNATNADPVVSGPVVVDDIVEDGSGTRVDLLQGASDGDGDTLTVTNVTGLVDGVTLNGNSLDLDPSDAAFQALGAGETLDIVVTYDIEDGNGGSVAQTATLTITGTNDDPSVAAVLAATATEDGGPFSVDLLDGASDIDGDTLSVANVTGLVDGVALNGTSLEVDPSDAAFQSLGDGDTQNIVVTYNIEDGNGQHYRHE